MASTVVLSRNLFINTEALTLTNSGDGTTARIQLPPSAFTIKRNQHIRLVLTNFEIRKNWYEVNNTNNTFFICDTTNNTLYPCIIPPGSYRMFSYDEFGTGGVTTTVGAANTPFNYGNGGTEQTVDFCSAIKFAVDKALYVMKNGGFMTDWNGTQCSLNNYAATLSAVITSTSSTVAWNSVTRKYTITFPVIGGTNGFDIYCLQLKNGAASLATGNAAWPAEALNNNPQLYGDWTFMDSHELIGGRPTRDIGITTNACVPAFTTSGTTSRAFKSIYVGQLNTLEALYLRIGSQSTNNFQCCSLERDIQPSTTMISTTVFARLPMDTSVYDDMYEMISYTDSGGDLFQINVDTSQLSTLHLSLTDDKNRPITTVAASEAIDGVLSFKCTIRYDVLQYPPHPPPSSSDIINSLSPVGFVDPNSSQLHTLLQKSVSIARPMPVSTFSGRNSMM